MLFNSFEYGALVLMTLLLYYASPMRRFQVATLFVASSVFYAFGQPTLLALLYSSIAINAVLSYRVLKERESTRRRVWAIAGVAANLTILASFKYGPLAAETLRLDAQSSVGNWLVNAPLPIGISFYTFQGMSLVIDVFRKEHISNSGESGEVEFFDHAIKTALFVGFFPQLVAGPILKAKDFFPQIVEKRLFQVRWEFAVKSLILGYFLKMVVADNLNQLTGIIVFPYFSYYSTLTLLALLVGYSCQIFADFAGYSLIAIGTAALFGYRLQPNFLFPYISQSLAEFWTRWHISLSTWLKRYLYIPLGGNRRGRGRTFLNLMIVMGLGGLWHGAAWSYAVWGLFHGVGLAVERRFFPPAKDAGWSGASFVKAAGVFLFVSMGWLLFKLTEIEHVGAFLNVLATNWRMEDNPEIIAFVALCCLPVAIYHAAHICSVRYERKAPATVENIAYGGCLAAVPMCAGLPAEFVYFQF